MFCCFYPSRASRFDTHNNEKKSLMKSPTTTINYQTIFSIPYAQVIQNDKIPINSPNVIETKMPETYLLFDSSMPNQAYETTCFSFDDTDVSTPVVFATATADGHFLLERLFQIEHVTAINPSATIRMHQINQTKTISSTTVSMARPFEDISMDPTTSSNPPDVQSNNITKSD